MNERLHALCAEILAAPPLDETGRRTIGLDELADRLDRISHDSAEIAWVIETLEAADCEVVSPPSEAGPILHEILPVARRLRATLGRAPTADEVAEAAGVEVESVRTALFYGRVIGRG